MSAARVKLRIWMSKGVLNMTIRLIELRILVTNKLMIHEPDRSTRARNAPMLKPYLDNFFFRLNLLSLRVSIVTRTSTSAAHLNYRRLLGLIFLSCCASRLTKW